MQLTVRNVNDALVDGLWALKARGCVRNSRNGEVLYDPEPWITRYTLPTERVLFNPERDANPFFHFMEALWMLAGRNDLTFPLYFNSRFGEFSDDGVTIAGAYGHRWRWAFGFDQIQHIVHELKTRPDSRRAVLTMWSPELDLDGNILGKDIPCNTNAYFAINDEGRLNMTIVNRSNDMLLGAYGANAVHMSVLQEYIAISIGVGVGYYYQISNNMHIYLKDLGDDVRLIRMKNPPEDPYRTGHVEPYPLVVTSIPEWDANLNLFMQESDTPVWRRPYTEPFFFDVAVPMFVAWHTRKSKTGTGLTAAEAIAATDWRKACVEWITRREEKKRAQS